MAYRKLSQSLSVNAAAVLATGAGGAVSYASNTAQPHLVHDGHDPVTNNVLSFVRPSPPPRIILNVTPPSFRYAARAHCEKNDATDYGDEAQRFERALAHHLAHISSYRRKWEYSENSTATTATKTPSRSWPDNVPSNDELSMLLHEVKYCNRSPNFRSDKEYCSRLSFRVASALVTQFDDVNQKRGFEILRNLAEKGYPDAMVYYGMILNEGRAGIDPNSHAAVSWFKRCADMYEHPQSLYELGVAYYTGEGVGEDEEEAVRLFQTAAERNHPAACYMLGDCLLDGIGVEMDRALALKWLVRAAELGHRGARSRVMAVLEKKEGKDYGQFTDASRQTLVRTVQSAANDGQIIQRKTTLGKQIGGGSRNPTELARRHTIVGKSRGD